MVGLSRLRARSLFVYSNRLSVRSKLVRTSNEASAGSETLGVEIGTSVFYLGSITPVILRNLLLHAHTLRNSHIAHPHTHTRFISHSSVGRLTSRGELRKTWRFGQTIDWFQLEKVLRSHYFTWNCFRSECLVGCFWQVGAKWKTCVVWVVMKWDEKYVRSLHNSCRIQHRQDASPHVLCADVWARCLSNLYRNSLCWHTLKGFGKDSCCFRCHGLTILSDCRIPLLEIDHIQCQVCESKTSRDFWQFQKEWEKEITRRHTCQISFGVKSCSTYDSQSLLY